MRGIESLVSQPDLPQEEMTLALLEQDMYEFCKKIKNDNFNLLFNLTETQVKTLRQSSVFQYSFKSEMSYLLKKGNVNLALKLADLNLHTFDVTQLSGFKDLLQQKMNESLSYYGSIDAFKKLTDSKFCGHEILQSVLKMGMRSSLISMTINKFKKILDLNLHTPETLQDALRERMQDVLSDGFFSRLERFKMLFSLNLHTPETLQDALRGGMKSVLENGNVSTFLELTDLNLHTFDITQEPWFRLISQKVRDNIQDALHLRMKALLSDKESFDMKSFKKLFNLNLHTFDITQEPWLQPALQHRMKMSLEKSNLYGFHFHDFKELVDLNLHTPDTLQDVLREGMKSVLENGNVSTFLELMDLNLHTFDITQEPWLQPALQHSMKMFLEEGNPDGFKELIDLNLCPETTLVSVVESIIVDNQALFSIMEQSVPGFTEKARVSLPVLLSTLSLRQYNLDTIAQTFIQAPHLTRAMEHEYGARLIVQYIGFDTLSQNNIDTLLTVQSEHPQDSTAYRLDVQRALRGYEKNPNISLAIKKSGIPLETWLNWDKEEHFALGAKENKAAVLVLENPIKRTQESFAVLEQVIKSTLAEYKRECVQARISEDTASLAEEVVQKRALQAQVQEEGNARKAEGIAKGIASLEARIAQPKQVPVWDKITGDLSGLMRLVGNIQKEQDVLKEILAREVTSAETRVAKKKDTKEHETELQKLTQVLKLRYEKYFEELKSALTSAVGVERAEGKIQEIRTQLGETFSHMNTDFGEFERVFTQDESKTSSLDGRPMRIRLASRAPQDLYIGNYTDCCVAIDNEHHGSESPISDYLTDLGMQIAIIEDEQEGIPIAAAWLFLGTNSKRQALVVDNIEGRGAYTSAYKTQLEEKLTTYLHTYAKALKIPLAQGASHNDLVVVPKTKNGVYVKLGGAHRADGIFLEAEVDSEDEEDEDVAEENGEEDEGDAGWDLDESGPNDETGDFTESREEEDQKLDAQYRIQEELERRKR